MRISYPFAWPPSVGGKPLLLLLATAIFLVSFLLGFFTAFPDTVLHSRVLYEVNRLLPPGNRLEADSVTLGFPLQLQLAQARLSMANAPLSELTLASVTLSPTLATLIGKPGLNISASSELGRLTGTVARSGAVDLQLRNGRFNLTLPELSQLHLAGSIVALNLTGQLQLAKGETLQFDAVFDELQLTGAKQLGISRDELSLGKLTAALAGSGRALQVEQLTLEGGVVTGTGTGRVVLQQPINASRLELNLQIRPEAGADNNLRTLLDLLGPAAKDGSHALQLRGRLLAPQLK